MMARAKRRAKAALNAAEAAIDAAAADEAWTEGTRTPRKEELRGPVEKLLREARKRRQAAAIAEWIRQGKEVVSEARERAEDVVHEGGAEYTIQEAEHLLRRFEAWSRRL